MSDHDEGRPYRCGCFVTGTGEQCTLESDHEGAHRFASDRMTPERLAEIREYFGTLGVALVNDILAELEAVTAERDAEKKRADMATIAIHHRR